LQQKIAANYGGLKTGCSASVSVPTAKQLPQQVLTKLSNFGTEKVKPRNLNKSQNINEAFWLCLQFNRKQFEKSSQQVPPQAKLEPETVKKSEPSKDTTMKLSARVSVATAKIVTSSADDTVKI